ncbi:MAG: carbohydrate kinase [Bacteroidia bacterium]|nr:carbohydrate kinase [Bacteroidia bacterium]NNK59223.1 carbohydrate kinase [Flavobacteriaceae bacterium]
MEALNFVCFGEVLWDVFPDHKKIGGAPLNVAVRLNSFGNNVSIISKVGQDDHGKKLLEFIKEKQLSTNYIQIDATLKTGKVEVTLDEKGSASYDIMLPRAWDNIEIHDSIKKLVASSDAFIFGSLASRNEVSKNTLEELLKLARFKIFDVNLRTPYYTQELLSRLMKEANFIKFNEDELLEICEYYGSEYTSIEDNICYISEQTNTDHICVTLGGEGAILYYNNNFFYNNGFRVKVKDTVGAGDSFLATLLNFLLKNKNPQDAINYACAVGALVTQFEGANPKITLEDIEQFVHSFQN